MAVLTVTGTPVSGVRYTVTTASSSDWASVSNSTYFFDLTDKIVYFKNSSGAVINPFIDSGTTSTTGSVISFASPQGYNSDSSPSTSGITDS